MRFWGGPHQLDVGEAVEALSHTERDFLFSECPLATFKSNMKNRSIVALVIVAVLIVLIYTQITFFVVPRIGALPDGKTIVITRLNKTEFIDSADAMCERMQGGVSLLCRGMTIGAVAEKSTILLRLPYSSWLYSISTGGKAYDR